jgi:hypothetical protein
MPDSVKQAATRASDAVQATTERAVNRANDAVQAASDQAAQAPEVS